MTTQTRRAARKRATTRSTRTASKGTDSTWKSRLIHYFPVWLLLGGVLIILMPQILAFTVSTASAAIGSVPRWIGSLFAPSPVIAPLFTDQVDYWAEDIRRWSEEYALDPNLLATIMQIESCGHPQVSSYAGAQGLFQVMPYHFDTGENQLDPDTNVKRGAGVLKECLGWANGDVGLAMACYNGGPSVTRTNYTHWNDQVKRYYTWGTGIYNDAVNNRAYSETLTRWLSAGGVYLCDQAGINLGIN